ncbi:NAD(P)-binding domain-containing protein [Nonomuraea sp. NPDC050691]|uniref:NAD(P)-binding domain-containing protein n=1 Tax=Nonomuraea sp. NPDC050691 TaxID=3155661 RepID=UPI0033DE4AEB
MTDPARPAAGRHIWRRRWDSLRLFTPARLSALPGMPWSGADRYPGKDEVADYLQAYAAHVELPVQLGATVSLLRPAPGGGFEAVTDNGVHTGAGVVVATGPFQQPHIPHLPLAPEVVALHSAGYRDPAQLPDGPVLVAGGGNSGVQIAAELAATRPVTVTLGTRQPVLPQRLLGADTAPLAARARRPGRRAAPPHRRDQPGCGPDVPGPALPALRRFGPVGLGGPAGPCSP